MIDGDPDPTSAGTAGDAALWGGSSAAVGMAANPLGAHHRWAAIGPTAWLVGIPPAVKMSGACRGWHAPV